MLGCTPYSEGDVVMNDPQEYADWLAENGEKDEQE